MGLGSACQLQLPVDEPWRCDPVTLAAGEVRARQIPCTDELIDGGEGQRGDWLIENDRIRVVVRDAPMALTQLGTAGGSIIDVAVPGGSDGMVELLPRFDGEALAEAWIELLEGEEPGLRVQGLSTSGADVWIELRLAADSHRLQLSGPDAWLGVLPPDSLILDHSIELTEPSPDLLLLSDGVISAEDARLALVDPTELIIGERHDALSSRWPESAWLQGISDGEWVELREGSELLARLPVEEGVFEGPVPPETDGMRATARGHEDGESQAPVDGAAYLVGERGELEVQLRSERGEALPGTLIWGDQVSSIPPGGGLIPTGPGSEEVWIHAGPAYEARHWQTIDLSGRVKLGAVLRPAVEGAWLIRSGVPAWPDAREPRGAAALAETLAGQGAQLAVLVADDEVAAAEVPAHIAPYLVLSAGSQAASDQGQPYAWPWSASVKRPAHGAAPWPILEPMDLLATQEKNGSRWTVVDTDWVQAAPPPWSWDPSPLALQIDSLDGLSTVIDLADQSIPIRVLGPLTWVEQPESEATLSETEIMRALIHGSRTATNGPQIRLRVEGLSPGEVLDLDAPVHELGPEPIGGTPLTVELEIEAPEWMPLDEAALIGPGGEILQSWTIDSGRTPRLSVVTEIPQRSWVAAICWGEESNPPLQEEAPWALSGIVWIGRP